MGLYGSCKDNKAMISVKAHVALKLARIIWQYVKYSLVFQVTAYKSCLWIHK